MKLSRNRLLWSGAIAVALLGAAHGSWLPGQYAQAAEDSETSPLVGKPAPAIKLDLLDGGKFNLADYKGKNVIIVDFWATWCGPCRMAMPILVDVAKEYSSKDVLYFAVDLKETPAKVKQYLEQQKLKIRVPMDKTGSVAEAYGVRGIPTMAIIDKKGVVRTIHVGFSPTLKKDLKAALDPLVKELASR